jgi:hypothetical protein
MAGRFRETKRHSPKLIYLWLPMKLYALNITANIIEGEPFDNPEIHHIHFVHKLFFI